MHIVEKFWRTFIAFIRKSTYAYMIEGNPLFICFFRILHMQLQFVVVWYLWYLSIRLLYRVNCDLQQHQMSKILYGIFYSSFNSMPFNLSISFTRRRHPQRSLLFCFETKTFSKDRRIYLRSSSDLQNIYITHGKQKQTKRNRLQAHIFVLSVFKYHVGRTILN